MKISTSHFQLLVLSAITVILYISCSRSIDTTNLGGTTETTSATISGTLWTDNGKRADKVTVRLTPTGFNPYTSGNISAVDSVVTDANGSYTFMVKSAGFFNVSAESKGKYAFEDSIFGSLDNATTVYDDTLKNPGSISGTARLQDGDDNRAIIILVLGSTFYTVPPDTTGIFRIPVLAEGEYLLRVLATDDNYGYMDTVVTVRSGENTVIPAPLRPPYEGVPSVKSVTAKIDTQTMMVTLSWPACDTSRISGYYIFRNTVNAEKPFAILQNTTTTFNDDVILVNPDRQPVWDFLKNDFVIPDPDSLLFGDTLRYRVAAIGKNREIGRIVSAPDVQIRSMLTFDGIIPLTGIAKVSEDFAEGIHSDAAGNFYVDGLGYLVKFDAAGRFVAQFGVDEFKQADENTPLEAFKGIATDENGNVYTYQSYSKQLTKFSPKLEPITQITVENSEPYASCFMQSDNNGHIYLMVYIAGDTTAFKTFDTALTEISSNTIPRNPTFAQLHDGIVYLQGYNVKGIGEYDIQHATLRDRMLDTLIGTYVPSATAKKVNYEILDVYHTTDNSALYVSSTNNVTLLFAFDRNDNFVGRSLFPNNGNPFCFGSDNRFYVYDQWRQQIIIYRIK